MFWRFGGLNNPAIDSLLDKEDLTLEDLLDEDELLQECKAHNHKLIEYLRNPSVLSQLLNYIIRDDLEENQRYKYQYIACEVLSCEIWTICEAVIDNVDLLNSFWQFLDRASPLNPLQASYFTKVNVVFLQKKMSEMARFIQSIPNVVKKILNHMETPTIMDLLLKLISVEEYPEGAGVIDWLNSEGLVDELISRLDPYLEPDVHSTAAQVLIEIITISQSSNPEQGGVGPNALSRELISENTVTRLVNYMLDPKAPHSTSTLTNGVAIFIQIIQKNYSDYSEEAILSLTPHQQQHPVVVDLSDMLRVLANRIGEFKALLENPKSVSDQIDTTIGKMTPLGFERFKICELFAELLHCSNMRLLNVVRHEIPTNGFYELKHVDNYSQTNPKDMSSENVPETGERQNEMEIPNNKDANQSGSSLEPSTPSVSSPILMEIVENVQTPPSIEYVANSNNANGPISPQLPVGDILKAKFIEYRIMPTCFDLFFNFKWNNFLHTVVYDMTAQIFHGRMDVGYNKALAISVFTDGQLTKRITKAQRSNDYEAEQPKGVRLGYMGHLTFIAEEVVKLLDSYAVEIGEKVAEFIEAEDWQEYLKTLRETKDRDMAHLGGQRPSNHDSTSPSREESEDDDEDDDNPIEAVADGDMASDQFARYLCQQITNNLPDKFDSSDESDDNEEPWMGDDYDRDEFEMRGPFGNANMLEGDSFESRRSSLGEDFGVDSDEDDPSSQWPSSNMQERKQLLTVADWSADFQSGFKASNTTQASDSPVTDQSSYAITSFASPNRQSNTIPTTTSTTTTTTTTPPSIQVLTPKETNVQQTSTPVKTIKDEDERDPEVKGSMETSILDNSNARDSSGWSDEGNLTDFSTFGKMGISVDSDDKVQDDTRNVVDGNSTVEKA